MVERNDAPNGAIPDATGWHKEMSWKELFDWIDTLEGEEWQKDLFIIVSCVRNTQDITASAQFATVPHKKQDG